MGYTDAQGRPELVMHPELKRGGADFRRQDEPAGGPDTSAPAAAGRPVATAAGQQPSVPARP